MRAGLDCLDRFFEHLDTHEVRNEQGDDIDVRRHLADGIVDAAFTQLVLLRKCHHLIQRVFGNEPRDLNAVHLAKRLQLEARNEAAADNSVTQWLHRDSPLGTGW